MGGLTGDKRQPKSEDKRTHDAGRAGENEDRAAPFRVCAIVPHNSGILLSNARRVLRGAGYCATHPPYSKRGCKCARLAFIPRPPCPVYHKMNEGQNERPAARIGILPFCRRYRIIEPGSPGAK